MSTIDEVLAAAEVVDAVCVIDGETRIISVPAEYKELGVESDEKVTRVKFQCPKIVGDNIDLTEYNLYINYKNASNKLNSYLVEDITVTGDIITFSWLLSRHVTESPGTISYIVCAKKSDNTGVINEWNTKVATGTVGIGLEATEEIEEQNIDAIEQILRSIVELENKVGGGGSGEAGGYYAPAVDAAGNLSWTASKTGMPSVDGANIKGPQGKSAYQYAQEGGYTGTEAEFAEKLAEEYPYGIVEATGGTVTEGNLVVWDVDRSLVRDGGAVPIKLPNPNALTFTGAVTGTYDGSAPLSVNIPSGGGSTGGGNDSFELIGEATSSGVSDAVGLTIPFDGSLYKTIIAYAYNLPAGNKKRIIIRNKKAWYEGSPLGWNSATDTYLTTMTNMNNTWSFFGAAIDVGGKLFTLGAAEANGNGGHGYFRFWPQNGALPTLSLSNCKFISLDCNSSSEMLPDGCSLIVWGVRK